MSTSNINENSNDKEKLQNFLSEIKFPRNFKKKLIELYQTEFDEKLDQILLKKDSEFMNIYLKRVRTLLEDMYSNDCFENEDLAILMKVNEIEIYEKQYKPLYNILNTAFSTFKSEENSASPEISENNEFTKKTDFFYDDDSMVIREINLNEEKESFKFLKDKIYSKFTFRKHCRFIDDVPRHFCQNGNLTNFIKLRSLKNNGNITHVICTECRMAYKSSCVLLYCNFCSLSYYSSINNSSIETSYLQPATWEKYHCSMIVNDQMRCIKCKDPLFFDMKENLLKCFNDRCMFESDPYEIYWTCVTCKKEFQTNAKIHNPLEYKLVKSSIKEALIFKKPARPNFLPCCQDQVVSDEMIFYHKKECYGRIFYWTMQNRQIIVCEKCRSLSNFDKFIWTCPHCGKRFKNKSVEKNTAISTPIKDKNRVSPSSNNTNIKTSSNNNLKYDIMNNSVRLASTNNTVNMEIEENSTPLSDNTKEVVNSRSFSNREILNPSSYRNYENNIGNQIGTNSVRSLTSVNSNKLFIRSNTSTNNNREKSDTDLKNSTSSNNNSEYAESSSKGISSSSMRREDEIIGNKMEFDEDSENSVYSHTNIPKQKISAKSCNALITCDENRKILGQSGSIKLFKSSKSLSKCDNEIEVNPVSKLNSHYKFQRNIKVTFEDQQQKDKKVINLIGTNQKEKDSKKRFLKSKSTKFLSLDLGNEKLGHNPLSSRISNLLSIEENEPRTPKYDFSINNYGFNQFNMDEYTIDIQVGEGSYGNIYKIHNQQDNFFALKKNIIHDKSDIPNVLKQYIIMNKLKHANILDLKGVTLQKLDMTTTSIYVLMDLATNDWGKEIKARSSEDPKKFYAENELILILKQLTAALAYMQKMNVAHRDLKPHNILIFENFIHKIADFGETQFLNENPFGKTNKSDERNGIRGTELFMSPILYQGLKEFKNDHDVIHNPYKSDCYSLGLCIFYAACLSLDVLYELRKIGIRVENEENSDVIEKADLIIKQVLSKHCEGKYTKDFENLLVKMLNINEKERPDFIELEKILQSF